MKIALFGSGDMLNKEIVKNMIKDADYTICADGGVKHLLQCDLVPDMVVGDLDSINEKNLKIINDNNVKIQKFPTDKDYTDMELAVEHAIELGAKDIVLGGVIGTRMDHSMGNIMMLSSISNKGVKATIFDNHNEITILKDEKRKFEKTHEYISILPLTNDGAIVSSQGLKYEVNNREFRYAALLGVSNEIVKDTCMITVHKGMCAILKSDD